MALPHHNTSFKFYLILYRNVTRARFKDDSDPSLLDCSKKGKTRKSFIEDEGCGVYQKLGIVEHDLEM